MKLNKEEISHGLINHRARWLGMGVLGQPVTCEATYTLTQSIPFYPVRTYLTSLLLRKSWLRDKREQIKVWEPWVLAPGNPRCLWSAASVAKSRQEDTLNGILAQQKKKPKHYCFVPFQM